jgi:hypothetical protein
MMGLLYEVQALPLLSLVVTCVFIVMGLLELIKIIVDKL